MKKKYVIEGALALLAVGVITAGVVINNHSKKTESKGTEVSEAADALDAAMAEGFEDMSISECKAAYPEYFSPSLNKAMIEELNTISKNEIDSLSSDEFIKLDLEDGTFIYCHNYKDTDFLHEQTAVSDNEIEELIRTNILDGRSETVECDHDTVMENDVVDISFTGSLDGVVRDDMCGSDPELTVGNGMYIEDFENGIIGMKSGETKKVSCAFPEDYGVDELNGKTAEFEITVNSIVGTKVTPTELTDDMVAELTANTSVDVTTAAEYKKMLKKTMVSNNIGEFMTGEFYVSDIDDSIVQGFYDELMTYYLNVSNMYGYENFEAYIADVGMSKEEFDASLIENAYTVSRYAVLFKAVCVKEGLKVTDESKLEYCKSIGYDSVESYEADFGADDNFEYYVYQNMALTYLSEL